MRPIETANKVVMNITLLDQAFNLQSFCEVTISVVDHIELAGGGFLQIKNSRRLLLKVYNYKGQLFPRDQYKFMDIALDCQPTKVVKISKEQPKPDEFEIWGQHEGLVKCAAVLKYPAKQKHTKA